MYEELDYRQTSLGELILRRRRILKLDRDVVEVILNDEHLMSDMFTASEIALARLPLDRMVAGRTADADGEGLHVLVGGLGLGYTADAVLGYEAVSSLTVVEYLAPLIEWHEAGFLPLARRLADDPRCRFVEGDFFALARGAGGFDPEAPGRRFDGIFLDIDRRRFVPSAAEPRSGWHLRALVERPARCRISQADEVGLFTSQCQGSGLFQSASR